MPDYYAADLAYIHDTGFSSYALGAAPGIRGLLKAAGIRSGHAVDLGCGSGRLAADLLRHGYRVTGVDQSAAILKLARQHAPDAQLVRASLLACAVPACDAVTSIGECINYLADPANSRARLRKLFRRIHAALRPGGLFVFDFAEPARVPAQQPAKNWVSGDGWAVLVSTTGDAARARLERRIVSFRQIGARYRRSEEVHRLNLYRATDLAADLAALGFAAQILTSYGEFPLIPGCAAIAARKAEC